MVVDPVILARIQFAFTISFHIIFPAFTIGLASWLAVIEWRFLKTGNIIYRDIYRMWVKIFAVCFGMGVVSGVTLSYQIGTNWSGFSDKVGNVIGPLLGYEVLTAFFLEASFLGIMLFGWKRVSQKIHFLSTCIVAIGTLISAFWILAANSWMQTPQGFKIGADGLLYPTNWMEIIFNPSFPYRFIHMITGTYLTTAFVVAGVASYYLLKKKYIRHAQLMFHMALIIMGVFPIMQLLFGHMHGENTLKHQPIKIAAMEGNWEKGPYKSLHLFGWPNEKTQTTDYTISLPGMASWVLTGSMKGSIPGLKDVPQENRPPVAIVFWSFRVMVGIGVLMIITGMIGFYLYCRKKLFTYDWFHKWCVIMLPSGFIAILAGWFVTETGRQPYIAYNVIKTIDSVSPVIGPHVAISLLIFIIAYLFIFGAGVFYIVRIIQKGPLTSDRDQKYYDHSQIAGAPEMIEEVEKDA